MRDDVEVNARETLAAVRRKTAELQNAMALAKAAAV